MTKIKTIFSLYWLYSLLPFVMLSIVGATVRAQGNGQRQGQPPAVATTTLELKATGVSAMKMGYMPVQVKLSAEKPTGVSKEPTYVGTPKYGVVQFSAPASLTKTNQ